MAQIGNPRRVIEVQPVKVPVEEPVPSEPAPVREPAPAPEPEKVPA